MSQKLISADGCHTPHKGTPSTRWRCLTGWRPGRFPYPTPVHWVPLSPI